MGESHPGNLLMRLVVLVLLGLIGVWPTLARAEPDLVTRVVLDGRVEMLLPSSFELMSEEMLKLKYPSGKPPTQVYTNEAGSVNVALNHTNDRLKAGQIPEFRKYLEDVFRRTYPSARWYRNEVTEINGRQFVLLDVRTPAVDTNVRNIIVGTSVDDRLLLVSFNVVQDLEGEWLAVGNKIIQSVKIIP
jgi:hypothetical protein